MHRKASFGPKEKTERRSTPQMRAELADALRARLHDIERASWVRVHDISDEKRFLDPEYVEALRATVKTALVYGIDTVERGERRSPTTPPALIAQARLAVRNRIGLDTVIRRYVAGHAVLDVFLREEAERAKIPREPELELFLRGQSALLERLIAEVSAAYMREIEARPATTEQRRAELVRRLLDGEQLDASDLDYDFGAFHLAAVAIGPRGVEAFREVKEALECRLLLVRQEESSWAWFASRRRLDLPQLASLSGGNWPSEMAVAFGEPAQGRSGWRFSHRQAKAALPIAMRMVGTPVRYADTALLSALLQDELLADSLRQLYLDPLDELQGRGASARQTLRAYIGALGNVSSAANALNVNRNTVARRIQAIEARIGRPLESCLAEIDTALRLEELSARSDRGDL